MLLTLSRHKSSSATEAVGIGTQPALLQRIYDAIERKLGDPDITPARIAQIEGISERYLQKLFECSGDNFTHYLRERRLQRCWAELGNPSEAHRSVSDIAFGCGFSDAAHFSRSFRDRFGVSPRAFRQQQAERLSGLGVKAGQRGWPQDAIAQLRPHRPAPIIAAVELEPTNLAPAPREKPAHHHLPVDASHVHWGFFSRATEAADRDRVGRYHHRRDADAARLRRSRTHDPGRSRRRERVSLDRGGQGRRASRRRADGRLDLWPRRRRRFWRPHLHRADRGQRAPNPATCWKSASSTWCRAQAAIRELEGQDLRQQRRGVVGLSL